MIAHHRKQFPVGQGFFHAATVSVGDAAFNYVYDCGSLNHYPRDKSIDSYLKTMSQGKVDLLFVSHLHTDHVNGIDKLAAGTVIDNVMLPYLTPAQRMLLIAQGADEDSLTGEYLDLVTDPPMWFGDRGVKEVIVTHGEALPKNSPRKDDERRGQPGRNEEKQVSPDYAKSVTLGIPQGGYARRRRARTRRTFMTTVVSDAAPFHLLADGVRLNWGFLTFVHPDPDWELRFLENFKSEFGWAPDDADLETADTKRRILGLVRERGDRRRLAALYRLVSNGKINRTSMMVYSGPFDAPRIWSAAAAHPKDQMYPGCGLNPPARCGWLGTGDADLKKRDRLAAFRRRYGGVIDYVQTFCLPHHGSRENLNLKMPWAPDCYHVASAGDFNQFDHPHNEVQTWVLTVGGRLILTSEYRMSYFDEQYVLG
jgi:hypothetical protein